MRVGGGGPKCWVTSASPKRTAQRQSFPRPNPLSIYAAQFYTSRSEFGTVCGKWYALFDRNIMFSWDFLPPTAKHFEHKGIIGTRKFHALQWCAQIGNRGVATKLCLEEPIWPPLPKEGVTQWWGRPAADWAIQSLHLNG